MSHVVLAGEIQMDEVTAVTLDTRLKEAVQKAAATRAPQDVAAVQQILDLKAAEFRAIVAAKVRRIKASGVAAAA